MSQARVDKYRLVTFVQKRLANPVMRTLLERGPGVPGYALLETTGRRTGQTRRTPVGDGLEGSAFWIVSEHGRRSAYVRNLEADPRVRCGSGAAGAGGPHTCCPPTTRASDSGCSVTGSEPGSTQHRYAASGRTC